LKCYELQGPSGIDGLTLVDKPISQPGAGQVLVRLKAATLNYRDLLIVKGGYGSRQKFPLVPLSDGAGLIEAVGSGVREFAVGDRVIGSFFESWIDGEPSDAKMRAALGGAVDGVLAEYRLFPAQALVKTPEHLSDIEAAALPCAGLTAWSAVVKLGDVKPGQTVLTQGTGGVSLFALQFAKMCGARVIATSSSDAKIERLKLLGHPWSSDDFHGISFPGNRDAAVRSPFRRAAPSTTRSCDTAAHRQHGSIPCRVQSEYPACSMRRLWRSGCSPRFFGFLEPAAADLQQTDQRGSFQRPCRGDA
jgi:hypothetical protein